MSNIVEYDHIYIGSYVKDSIKTNILYYGESCGKIAQTLYKNINIDLKLHKSMKISFHTFKYVTSIIGNVYKINIFEDIITDIEKDILNIMDTNKIRKKWNNDKQPLVEDTYQLYLGDYLYNPYDYLFIYFNNLENKLVFLDGSSEDFIYKPKKNLFGFKMNTNSEIIMFPTNDWKFISTYTKKSFKSKEDIKKLIEYFNNYDINYDCKQDIKSKIYEKIYAYKTLYLKK